MQYPESLENWWVQFALQHLGCKSIAEKEHLLEQEIQRLSDAFTKQRNSRTKDYFSDPAARLAYGLFFFPQTYIRAVFAMRDIWLRGWTPPERCAILDLGAGMGAASLAIASGIPNSHITAIDRSAPALSIFTELASIQQQPARAEVEDLRFWCNATQRQFDFIVASFSLSETKVSSSEWTNLLKRLLSKRGIVLIVEPSLRETSEWLESWRDELSLRPDLSIWAPCLHRQKCPLLSSGKYWCHEVRSWQVPESLAFVNRKLYREIHVSRFSFLAFGKIAPEPLAGFATRLISPISRQKRDFLFSGCSADGFSHSYRIQSRAMNSDQRGFIRKWERGDILMEDKKGVHILESRGGFVVQSKTSPLHEVRND